MPLEDFSFTKALLGAKAPNNKAWEAAGEKHLTASLGTDWRQKCELTTGHFPTKIVIKILDGAAAVDIGIENIDAKGEECATEHLFTLATSAGTGMARLFGNLPDGSHGRISVNQKGQIVFRESRIGGRVHDAVDGTAAQQWFYDSGVLQLLTHYSKGDRCDTKDGIPCSVSYSETGDVEGGMLASGKLLSRKRTKELLRASTLNKLSGLLGDGEMVVALQTKSQRPTSSKVSRICK